MNNAHNLNIHTGGQDPSVIVPHVHDALNQLLLSSGEHRLADDDEPAQRTLILAKSESDPWITLFDDAPYREAEALALDLSSRIGSPIVFTVVHDSDTLVLALYHRGEEIDALYWPFDAEERKLPVPAKPDAWVPLLKPGATPTQLRDALAGQPDGLRPLEHVAELIQLKWARWVEIDNVSEGDPEFLLRIRLASAKRRPRTAASKPTKTPKPKLAPAPEPPPQALMIPTLLIGRPAEVKRRLKKVVKIAAETGDWSRALAGQEHVPLDDVAGLLTTSRLLDRDDPLERILIYMLEVVIGEEVIDFIRRQDLLLAGMSRPWFCLAVVSSSALHIRQDDSRRSRWVVITALKRVLRWFPELLRWDEQTDVGMRIAIPNIRWPMIYIPLLNWCYQLGLGLDLERDVKPAFDQEPSDVAFQILQWVARAEKALPPDESTSLT